MIITVFLKDFDFSTTPLIFSTSHLNDQHSSFLVLEPVSSPVFPTTLHLQTTMLREYGKDFFQRFHFLLLFIAVLLIFLWPNSNTAVHAQTDSCNSDPSRLLSAVFNDSSTLYCKSVWNSFILRYSQKQRNTLSIVLSATYTSGWVGMGFSKDGMMVGSSAMVGWISTDGKADIKQYFLRGKSASDVIVNQGQLQSTGVTPIVVLNGATIYLAFQLKTASPLTQQQLIFASGSKTPNQYVLTLHEYRTTVLFDFSTGSSSSSSSSSNSDQLKVTHGALAITGWGVLLPIGAVIARYCRQWEPLWFQLHLFFQLMGYTIGVFTVLAGLSLYYQIHSNVIAHRDLGIFLLVLGTLQVSAFCLRPNKDAKIRKYWNWYHHWVGRLTLFLAAVNIVLGLELGGAGIVWKVGYGVILSVTLVTVTALESRLRIEG